MKITTVSLFLLYKKLCISYKAKKRSAGCALVRLEDVASDRARRESPQSGLYVLKTSQNST